MKKRGILVAMMLLLVLCVGIPVHAAEYKTVTSNAQKNRSYYMWVDGGRCLHIRKSSGEEVATIAGCSSGVSNGKTIYYINRSGNGATVYKYSILAGTRKYIAYLRGVNRIVGAYNNRLILEASPDGTMDTLYAYNMNTGKMKKISYTCECVGAYKKYFVFRGITGAITPVQIGVYNAKINKVKALAEKSWYMLQKGKQIYYAKEIGSTDSYFVRKLKLYRYTVTTGKSKPLSKTITVSISDKNRLTKSKFVYYDGDGDKHIIKF